MLKQRKSDQPKHDLFYLPTYCHMQYHVSINISEQLNKETRIWTNLIDEGIYDMVYIISNVFLLNKMGDFNQ